MLTFEAYCILTDQIIENGNIAKALIECSEEDVLTAVNKHIGITMKLIIANGVADPDTRDAFMNTLFHRYSEGPFTSKEHGYAAIDAINRAEHLFIALHTDAGNYADPEFESFENEEF